MLARQGAPDVAHRDAAGRLLEPVADRAPGAHVLRLLLRPDDLVERRVRRDELARRLDRERVELLEPGDRDLVGVLRPPRGRRCRSRSCRCRARAGGSRALSGTSGVEHRPEGAGREILEGRRGLLEPQQALRRHHDERPRDRIERLPAEQVEVLGGGGAVRDPHVLLRGELQEPLEPGARVLGPVALVAVRQQERQPRGLLPLRETARDELVDDRLRAVREVAELRLPEDERLRRGGRVAVLEADAAVLGERRVVDLERRLRALEVLHRDLELAGAGVVEHEVAVRERAALGVLAGEADRDAVAQQRGERERLGVAPVDAALVERRQAALELALELRVDREPVGDAHQLLGQPAQALLAHGGLDRAPARRRACTCSSCVFAGMFWPNEARSRSCASCRRVPSRPRRARCASSSVITPCSTSRAA